MKCEACLPLVGEYFDGELDSRVAGAVRAHIAGCQSCSDHYESLRLNQDIYDKFLDDVKLSSTAWQGVHRRIHEEQTQRKRGFFSGLILIPRFQFVAATIVLIVLGIMVLRLATRPEEKQVVATTDPIRIESPNPVIPEPPVIVDHGFKKSRGTTKVKRSVVTREAPAIAMLDRAAAFTRAMESARTELEANRPVTLKTDVARHFEKTRLLLLSLKNTSVSDTEAGVNLSYEKTISRKLADSNVLLRRETANSADRSAAELLDRIEPLLIEIANMPDRASAKEVASISQRIARRDVIGLLQSQTF